MIFQVHPYLVKKLENIRNTFSILSMFRWRCACVDRTDHRAREDTHTARKGGKNTKNIILNIRRAHSFFFNSLNNVRKHEECHFFLFFKARLLKLKTCRSLKQLYISLSNIFFLVFFVLKGQKIYFWKHFANRPCYHTFSQKNNNNNLYNKLWPRFFKLIINIYKNMTLHILNFYSLKFNSIHKNGKKKNM